MDYPDYDFYCTLVQSRKVWKGGKHNLDVIAARCGYALSNHLSPSKIFTSAPKIQLFRQHLLLTCEEDLEEID